MTAPATTLREADILAALRDCYHPTLSLNVVALGLVHSIRIAPDPEAPGANIPGVPARHRVAIELLAADADDMESSAVPALIENRLAAFETVSLTEVTVVAEPAWTTDRISAEARAHLTAQLTSSKPAHVLVQIQTNPRKP